MRGISIDVLIEIGVQERVMKQQQPDLRRLKVVPDFCSPPPPKSYELLTF
jgi:hypothetical protein